MPGDPLPGLLSYIRSCDPDRLWARRPVVRRHVERRRRRRGCRQQLLAAHPAPGRDVGRGRRVVGQHPQHRADRHLRQPPGQRDHRQRAALAPAVEHLGGSSQPHHPGLGAQVGDHRRAARPGTGRRPPRCVSRCSETRTLPCDSTPIAASTWLGPQRGRRARRARRHREAAPVQRVQQRLAVDVQAGERHQVRQPVDRVADHLHVGHGRRDRRRGSGRPARDSRGRLGRRLGRHRPQRRRGRHDRGQVDRRAPARARVTPTGCPCAPPAARRRAGRPTCGRSRSAATSRRAPAPGRPTGRRRPSSGTPAAGTPRAAAATGCTVPTSWLALISAASATPGPGDRGAPSASRSTRPSRSTGTGTAAPPAATCRPAACSTAECSTAECTSVARPARRPARPPATAARTAAVPLAVKVQLVRAYAQHLGGRGRAPRRAAGGPGGPGA